MGPAGGCRAVLGAEMLGKYPGRSRARSLAQEVELPYGSSSVPLCQEAQEALCAQHPLHGIGAPPGYLLSRSLASENKGLWAEVIL